LKTVFVRFLGFVILLFIEVFEEIGVAVHLKMATAHFTGSKRLRIIEFSSLSQQRLSGFVR